MTSTSFNVGLRDDPRNSSRVLRPPGGGHTDIFAASEPLQIRKDSGRNASSILEGTNTNAAPASPVKASAPPQQPTPSNEPAAPAARSRVPPGGFSSGLW